MKSLYEAMIDPDLMGRTFGGPTFKNWRTVAKVLDGLPLDADELAFYQKISGRSGELRKFLEAYFVMRRRLGKTLFAGGTVLHAALQDYSDRLGPGEVATCALICETIRGARTAMNFVKGLIEDSPLIRDSVLSMTAQTITFKHRVVLEVHAASFRSTRGYSYACVILDELAFFRDDLSSNPDVELVRAVRPGLANLGGRLIGLSSPHARRGHLYAMYAAHFGKPSDVLVLQAGGNLLNPTIDEAIVERARAEDPVGARSEWDAEFREDTSQYLADELVDRAIQPRVRSLPRLPGLAYYAFIDPSGGRHDAMTLAVSHQEAGGRLILDRLAIVEPPFTPETVVEQFADILNAYGVRAATGDRFGAAWVDTAFRRHGITYIPSELDKSAIYVECLPLFTQGLIELLDIPKLHTELRLLERRPRPGGRGDMIDHPPRATDDCSNSTCGSLLLAANAMNDRNTMADNVTHALTDYSPLERDSQPAMRPGGRHLPPGFAGGAFEETYSSALRIYDPLDR